MDCGECIDDTVKEGRAALFLLEQQLQDNQLFESSNNDNFSVGSRQTSRSSERRLLDQAPRDLRLQNRLGSPIGNLSELDDRGLLEGGGSVPSYYSSSSQQRSRRPLEMKKRSSRLLERGKEAVTKMSNALFHMVRVLNKKGLSIEDCCQQLDSDATGTIQKKQFASMLKNIGLPFSSKDLNEIILRYAEPPKFETINYDSFLSDAGVKGRSSERTEPEFNRDIDGSIQSDLSLYTRVLYDVKRMLVETVESLGRQVDDIYRMFARWDSDGSGTITATQFLRVLVRLHVDLTDQDQDFLVDLLDTTSMGRIEFESLLDYCFIGVTGARAALLTLTPGNKSPRYNTVSPDDNASAQEEHRTVSQEGSSVGSNYKTRRPHTASPSSRTHSPERGRGLGPESSLSTPQRPITASARAGPFSEYRNYTGGGDQKDKMGRPESAFSDVPNDSCFGDEEWVENMPYDMQNTGNLHGTNSQHHNSLGNDRGSCNQYAATNGNNNNNDNRGSEREGATDEGGSEMVSLNDNTVLTEPDEFTYGHAPNAGTQRQWENLDGTLENNNGDVTYGDKRLVQVGDYDGSRNNYEGLSDCSSGRLTGRDAVQSQNMSLNRSTVRFESSGYAAPEPIQHLNFLATQTLTTVRDMVMERNKSGKSLAEIFRHFDRAGKSNFDARDFMRATADLHIETTERVASLAVSQIALDGRDNVCYGEFQVFIRDPYHRSLEAIIQQRLAEQLEKHGRAFQANFHSIFWEEEKLVTRGTFTDQSLTDGTVSLMAFVASLRKLGLKLSPADLDRVITRFDLHGQLQACSATRFMRMVERSEQWQSAEGVLINQYVAEREASLLRAELSGTPGSSGGLRLSIEMINMAEHLGIKAITEPHLLWIVRDATNVALPAQWIILKDSRGRPFFYNRGTNKSRWDHPLDPHFKKLRDQHRVQSFSRDRGTKSDKEESENEYLTTSIRTEPPAQSTTVSKGSPAVLSYVRYDQEQYTGNVDLSINNINKLPQGQGQGQRQMYVSAGRQGNGPNRPNSAALETNRNWTDTMLPSVKVGKHMNGNNIVSAHKVTPSSSSSPSAVRVEIRPRSKSATVGRRPGPSLPSPGAIYRDQTRQSNPTVIFSGSGITSNSNQNQIPKNRTASGEDFYGISSGSNVRLSSAGTSRKNTNNAGSKLQNMKISDSSLFTPKIGVADQNRTARDLTRNFSQVPIPPKESGREEKLAFMYGSDVINRLDSIVADSDNSVSRNKDISQSQTQTVLTTVSSTINFNNINNNNNNNNNINNSNNDINNSNTNGSSSSRQGPHKASSGVVNI